MPAESHCTKNDPKPRKRSHGHCSDQEAGVSGPLTNRTVLISSTWQINMASNDLKVVLGTMELGKRGLMEDQPVSAVYRIF